MSYRSTIALILLIALIGTSVLVGSCDEYQKRETLSFFFDGVPPIDPNAVEVQGEMRRLGHLEDEDQAVAAGQTWSVHKPQNDCAKCHGERSKAIFSKEVHLVEPVPELCWNCHAEKVTPTSKTKFASSVHGPVAVGQCLLCHHHHRSQNLHLLKEPVPALCYMCHDRNDIASIPGHRSRLESQCNECHEAHASSSPKLLKPGWRGR